MKKRNDVVKVYSIDHDGCYSNIVVMDVAREHVDNLHTTFFKFADAKRELVSNLKSVANEYNEALKRIRMVSKQTVDSQN
jgi:uncharacterized coiled-coil DUF342 family protein